MNNNRSTLVLNKTIHIIYNLCFAIIVMCSVFCSSTRMTDTHILPKWLFSLGGLSIIGVFYGIVKLCRYNITLNVRFCYVVFFIISLSQAIYAFLQEEGLFHSYFTYKMVGSFDNPAGLSVCICVGVSPCFYLFRDIHHKLPRCVLALSLIILCSMLILSGSRAGIIGAMSVVLYYIWYYIKKYIIRFALIITMMSLLVGLYFIKRDSADGRILIMKCCWDMIKERPIWGHGFGAVEAHYMDYQAAYLALNPNSHYSMLADNVKHTFNEFVRIIVEFGLIGCLCLLLAVFFLWLCYHRYPSKESETAIVSLLSIAVVACFSYPLTYPFVWLVVIFDVWVIVRSLLPKIRRLATSFIMIIVISLSVLMLHCVWKRIKSEYEWWNIVNLTPYNDKKRLFDCYEDLMPELGNEPYFLYNYSTQLYLNGEYKESLHIAERCRKFWADYDLELLQGECCMQLEDYEKAIKHYILASQMCPARFMPLYRMFKLYKKQGIDKQVQTIGDIILKKNVKIPSLTIDLIKKDVLHTLNSY